MKHLIPVNIHTIDLNFQDTENVIAVYAIEHQEGLMLVECGPASTLPALIRGIEKIGYSLQSITDILLTHIHLDHAGAAGVLSHAGIDIHVHPKGAAHLLDPGKLISSATRVYGGQMSQLWGEIQPVLPEKLHILADGDVLVRNAVRFKTISTPGHAEHHNVYIYEKLCFSGDACGIRLPDDNTIFLPTPPPEFHIGKWVNSIAGLLSCEINFLALTHFGIFADAPVHLTAVGDLLNNLRKWLGNFRDRQISAETMLAYYNQWMMDRKIKPEKVEINERINPAFLSVSGILRYLEKYAQEI